jgi:hypothetical protein
MAVTLNFYLDAGLTTLATSGDFTDTLDGAIAPQEKVFYLGSTASGKQFIPVSNPADPIVCTITNDAIAPVQPTSSIKLALTQGALAAATGGAALTIKPGGTPMLSGVGNAVPVWVQFNDQTDAVEDYANLSLTITEVTESAV